MSKHDDRPDFCKDCPIGHVTEGYVPLREGDGNELWVSEFNGPSEIAAKKPFMDGSGSWLNSLLKAAKLKRSPLNIINTIGCMPKNRDGSFAKTYPGSRDWYLTDKQTGRDGVAHCRKHHLEPALRKKKWSRIVALGNEALRALTGKTGILLWRGSPLQLREAKDQPPIVMPTLHPAYLMRSPHMFSVTRGDIKRGLQLAPEHFTLYPTLETLQNFKSTTFAFDLEWDENENITLCGVSDANYSAIVCEFKEPYISELRRIFESAEHLIGWNIIGADLYHLRKLGWRITAKMHDTMLKQHLVMPDHRHSLQFASSVFTNRVFWKGRDAEKEDWDTGEKIVSGAQWKTWDDPANGIPVEYGGYVGCKSADEAYRLYNARDNAASFEIERPIQNVLERYGMEHVYWNVSVPAGYLCEEMNRAGWRIDPTRVREARQKLDSEIVRIEKLLPEGLKPAEVEVTRNKPAPPHTYKPKTLRCKGKKKDGTLHESCEIVFTTPGILPCPICGAAKDSGKMSEAKIVKVQDTEWIQPWNSAIQVLKYAKSIGCKTIEHKKTKRATTDKTARAIWGRKHTEFALVDKLKFLSTQRNSFFRESMQHIDRVYFNLLVHGTSEGRLSCSGRRRGTDPNIQNQPEAARVLYLPDHDGWGLLNVDWKSGENWLTAFLAGDNERMERLAMPGYSEHADLASRIFGKEVTKSNENKDLYTPGKVVNHGLNYGMGWKHMQENLAVQGYNYSAADVKEMILEAKRMNAGTAAWQRATVALVERQGYLKNVFGRKRWFSGRTYATEGLAYLPASTLADMMLRTMIAFYPDRFVEEIEAEQLEVALSLPEHWRMIATVHDSFVFTGPHETRMEAAHIVKSVMTQKWAALDGFRLDVEAEYSTDSWGSMEVLEI